MGYEMKFYVVNKSKLKDTINDKEFYYGQIVAMYDYCKDYDLADFIDKNSKPTDTYIYVGEQEVVEDCYGDPLAEIPVDSLLNYLEAHSCSAYRRYWPLVSLLRGFKEVQDEPDNEKFEDLIVLRYGY